MKCRPSGVMQRWQGALWPVAPAYMRKGPLAYMCALAAVPEQNTWGMGGGDKARLRSRRVRYRWNASTGRLKR